MHHHPIACRPLHKLLPCLALSAGLALTGCGGSDDGETFARTGLISVSIKDAPVDEVSEVIVTFDRIDLKPRDGAAESITLASPRTVDLLALQGTNAASLIEEEELPAGNYDWMRLYLVADESKVVETVGGEFGLFIPGNQPPSNNPNQRFLHLASPFVIPADRHARLTIDVDLRKALVKRSSGPGSPYYMLRPSLRLVDNSETGTLTGTVSPALISDPDCTSDPVSGGNAVYVYRGATAIPGDIFLDDNGSERPRTDGASHPFTSANVTLDTSSGEWQYTVGFLPAGEYSVAFTCQALDDEPGSEDGIVFTGLSDVTIVAGEVSRVDLE
jgi:hypothetical protein